MFSTVYLEVLVKVLSLFDGISCGQLALNRLGIVPDVYFASEIETDSIKVTQKTSQTPYILVM